MQLHMCDTETGMPDVWNRNRMDELPTEATIHSFTVCHFGAEAFLPECPFVLALIEWPEADTLFLTRLLGVDHTKASLDWVWMKVKAKFLRLSKFSPTDVYFVPAE